MRTTIALAAAVMLLAAAPAFARGHTPQTEFSGPGSAGSIQEQDMQRSQAKTDNQNSVQTPNSGTTTTQQPTQQDPQRDPMDPQQNPHYLHTPH
jgi:hypothetical protein